MKTKEVFTPAGLPTWTYVDDHLIEKKKHLLDAMEDGNMLVSIIGPSVVK